MKARLEQGEVKLYAEMPQAFLTVSGFLPIVNELQSVEGQVIPDALLMPEEDLKTFGFFEVQEDPLIDDRIEEFGDFYFDQNEELFKKEILDKDFIWTLEECKENVIKNYDSMLHQEFLKTDYHYIKQLELGTEIPEAVLNSRSQLRVKAESVKAEINALTTKKEVLKYELPNYKF